MKKDFTPEGMLFGHNTLYFDNPNATPMAKEFVAWYADKQKDYPNWEADRAYFAIASYKEAVEARRQGQGHSLAWQPMTSSTPWIGPISRKPRRQGVAGARTTSPTRPSCRASRRTTISYDFVTLDPSKN